MTSNWLRELESFDWWDSKTKWGKSAENRTWFIRQDDTEGYFLVDDDRDTYVVYPEISYQIDDQGYDGPWWLENGTQVGIECMGKWKHMYGFHGPSLPQTNSGTPQDIGIQIEGGWAQPKETRQFLKRAKSVVSNPKNFNQYVARVIGLVEGDIWVFASALVTFNIGLALVPVSGRLDTFEMSNLEIATADPEIVVSKYEPSKNLRKVGIGVKGHSFMTSGSWQSEPVNDEKFESMVDVLNQPLITAGALHDALGEISNELRGQTLSKELRRIHKYLVSPKAEQLFECLQEAGYSVALIPLGGRTIWKPLAV